MCGCGRGQGWAGVLAAPGPEELVGGGERLVEAGRILAPGLREVRTAAAPAVTSLRRRGWCGFAMRVMMQAGIAPVVAGALAPDRKFAERHCPG